MPGEGSGAASLLGATNAGIGGDGTLVYVAGAAGTSARRSLVFVDRQGREVALGASPRSYVYPRLSADDEQVAVSAADEEQDLWLWDVERRQLVRATFHAGVDMYPVWTPDGRRLLWASNHEGPFNLYIQSADGTGAVTRLTNAAEVQLPTAKTPDGRSVLIRLDGRADSGTDRLLVPLSGESKAVPLLTTPAAERNGDVSPDGRWLAYDSDESGRFEVYVRPFPQVDAGKWQVSAEGGSRPIWARKGGELFYRTTQGAVMAVTVDTSGARFRAGQPAKVVGDGYFGASESYAGRTYDVTADGSRFLMIKDDHTSGSTPHIVLVQNWIEEPRRLIPR